MRIQRGLVVGLCACMFGCANLNTVNHRFGFDGHDTAEKMRAASVDANQRFLTGTYGHAQEGLPDMWRFCADPSPDGLAVFGGSLAASASKNDASGQLTAAAAAQAASIGLRTQSITLLRDAQ